MKESREIWNSVSNKDRRIVYHALRSRHNYQLGSIEMLSCRLVLGTPMRRLLSSILGLFPKGRKYIRRYAAETKYYRDMVSRGSSKEAAWIDIWEFYKFYKSVVAGVATIRPPLVIYDPDSEFLCRLVGKHRTGIYSFLGMGRKIACQVATTVEVRKWLRKIRREEIDVSRFVDQQACGGGL